MKSKLRASFYATASNSFVKKMSKAVSAAIFPDLLSFSSNILLYDIIKLHQENHIARFKIYIRRKISVVLNKAAFI